MSCESKRWQKNKQQLAEFWQCTNTASGKMQFSCFPFYQVVQKHKLCEVPQ